MSAGEAPGKMNSYAYGPVNIDAGFRTTLRIRLQGTKNASFKVQCRFRYVECVFESEWEDSPEIMRECVFGLPSGIKIDSIVLYTMTVDGKKADNRFESVVFESNKRRTEFNLGQPEGPAEKHDGPNMLALAATEPYRQLPSSATVVLHEPQRLEKLYLLTANLTKNLKCYYPGAEIIVRYVDRDPQTIQLIPPYTMSCIAQPICPRAYTIPFGRVYEGGLTLPDRTFNLAVLDFVLDADRKAVEFEFRCVATETIFGIVGITALKARLR